MAEVVIESLSKGFGEGPAVDDISLTVPEGKLVSLLGPSGCGKTTTLRCIAGLERNDKGTINIGSRIVSAPERRIFVPPSRRQIGMVFQSYAIWPHMTVAENIAYPLRRANVSKADIASRVSEVLSLVDLTEYGDRSATKLSGGQQQRVALARAVVADPELLLLDEPLSNLDAKLRDQMRFELRSLQQRLGTTSIYVTHDQGEAMAMSDLIVVMRKGEIVQVGTPRDVYSNPVNTYVANFIGAANLIDVVSTKAIDSTHMLVTTKVGNVQLKVRRPGMEFATNTENSFLCLRPESATITIPGRGYRTPADVNSLEAEVVSVAYLGERQECSLRFGDNTLRLFADPSLLLRPGSKARIEFGYDAAIALKF